LGNFCAEQDDEIIPSLPGYVHFHHDLADVKRVVQALLVSRWHWTIKDILETDERWLDDVLLYASCDALIGAEASHKKAAAATY
jgi:hypothetical protein